MAAGTVVVHAILGHVVALGHVLGRLQHVPVDLGLGLHQRRVHQHVLVGLVLHATDAFHTARHVHVAFARDDALRRHGDGLQAAAAEAVDGDTAHGDGQASAQRDLAGDVAAGGAFGRGAAHQHVFNGTGVDAGALHGVLHGVATQGGAVGHVEGALPALGQGGAGGGNDDGVAHVNSSVLS
jgi:hypothetical protein